MAKKAGRISAVLVAALIVLPLAADAKVVERIIARINNDIVTQRQYEREREKLRTELAEQYSGAELEAQLRQQSKDLLRNLIDQDLMVQKAKDLDMNVETDLVKQLDEIRQRTKLGSLEELQNEVEKTGLIWEDYKDSIRRDLLMREVIGREVGSRIIITRDDTRKYFKAHPQEFAFPEGVHLAHVLISTEKHKPEEAEKRAKDALAEVKAGARWNDVVKKYSDDTQSVGQGGDIGFFKKGTLASAIAQAIANLDVNDTTDLIKDQYGYRIVKVLERRRQATPTFDEVEQRVQEAMYNQKIQTAMRDYLRRLRKESYLSLAPGYVDTGSEKIGDTELAKKAE